MMEVLKAGTLELIVERTDRGLACTFNPSQYKMARAEQIRLFLDSSAQLLEGEILELRDEEMTIHYHIDEQFKSLPDFLNNLDLVDRLLVAQKLTFLHEFATRPIVPFIHPENIFILGDVVKLAHRGVHDIVVPYKLEEDEVLKQYKALITYILNPKLKYSDLVEGIHLVKNPFAEQLVAATNFAQVNDLLNQQVVAQKNKRDSENILVNRNLNRTLRIGTVGLSVLAIILGIFVGVYSLSVVPRQDSIIAATSEYINKDYNAVLERLGMYDPLDLPTSAQFMLAESAIRTEDSIFENQKDALLGNLSQKTQTNTLLFWIYTGTNKLEQALDIAQNIGDNQLISLAYLNLYDKVKADSTMSGAEKQAKLKEYEEEIQKYEKLLGLTDNETEDETGSSDGN
ncbi:type VII secretion protein EssB [Streptococcus oriscaviae]|uniref:Type VII secretion protein EssB n=1 Tax=Streptococcus oriscaviae TaxID=2781599 RepID=A0ABX7YND1_9STRE|nr:type VII secretion protein EssB [Streptococcus oriscaviae]QUE55208.1 type VII secretion protein EssB [Streptococcus oriscaviae]